MLFADALLALMAALVAGVQAYRLCRVNDRPHLGDAFTYLRVAREIRGQGRLFPALDFYYTGEREFLTLPPLLMALLAPLCGLPYRVLIQLPLILDLAIAWLIDLAGTTLLGLTDQQALLASLIFLLTPINAITGASLTPRSLGLLGFAALLFAYTGYLGDGRYGWLPVMALAVTFALLAQRMVTQIIVLLALPVAAAAAVLSVSGALWLIPAVAGGFAAAWAFTGGRYRAVIGDHLRRVLLHVRHGQQDRFTKEFGNPLQIVKANPWLLLAGAVLLPGHGVSQVWLPSALFLLGIVLLAVFWVFGNSVNHLFFGAPAAALLAAQQLPQTPSALAFGCAVALLCSWLIVREFRVIARRRLSAPWLDCMGYIAARGWRGRALVLPWVSFPPLVYYTNLVMVASGHGSKAITYDRMLIKTNMNDGAFMADFITANQVEYLLVETSCMPSGQPEALRSRLHVAESYRFGGVELLRLASSDTRPAGAPWKNRPAVAA